MWHPYKEGKTIGAEGSESGVIIQDEEWATEARITLERGRNVPYSITCGIVGLMCHTTFSDSEEKAKDMLESMKLDLQNYVCQLMTDEETEESMGAWCDWFTRKY